MEKLEDFQFLIATLDLKDCSFLFMKSSLKTNINCLYIYKNFIVILVYCIHHYCT